MKRRVFLQSIPALAASMAAGSEPREVMTVRGRIRAERMGVTLTHEHLLANFNPHTEGAKDPVDYGRDEVLKIALPHLARIRDLGCRTFIDATAVGLGRDVRLLRRLSEQSGLNILTTTGNYAAVEYRFLPQYVYDSSPEVLARRWIDEWIHGIDGTDVRPGFIKLGFNGRALSDVEKTLIRAGAIAHRETGLVIGAHTGQAVAAFEQLDILEDAGVKPNRIVIGHVGNLVDPQVQVHKAICRRGAFIGFDRQGGPGDAQQVPLVMALLEAGFAENLMFSADISNAGQMKKNGGQGYAKTLTVFVPKLKAAGANDDVLRQIMMDNPRRFLAFVPKKPRR